MIEGDAAEHGFEAAAPQHSTAAGSNVPARSTAWAHTCIVA